MNTKDFDTREAIISSGRQEFLTNGFEKASLRTICKNAGVTTGAFYAYFAKKEDLFAAIVDPMLVGFHRMYSGVVWLALADVKNNERNEVEAIEFICRHRDEFRLLFECSEGTRYEGFREELLDELFMRSYQMCFDRYAGHEVDPNIVRLFVRIKFAQYMELIYGGYSMNEVRRLIRLYSAFTEDGFLKLIKELKSKAM